ncbi:MAG TPA: S8 family serine peptidase, partial [Allosphingosinicella sp.]|nr:S8 family serine peptidase [Allosphingosinicella sp.]
MPTLPSDPLFVRQWHLDRSLTPNAAIDLNVVPVWEDYTGLGVRVAVIDRPVEHDHPDLDGNYVGLVMSPEGHAHGTQVAGLIAAERNGEGGVGVAYGASITGLGGSTAAVIEAARFDVANISLATLFAWDRTTDWKEEYAHAAETGRDGLGTIVVVASGNNREGSLDANLSPFTQHRHIVVVGAVGKTGMVSDYSSEGATLTVVAPSSSEGLTDGVTTTDLQGSAGSDHGDYTSHFGGTSASAPLVSGVAALMLEANPALGWRDVQEILAITARHTGTAIGEAPQGPERFAWTVNDADIVNGGGFHFSNDYGFGLVDALAAVRVAETWDRQQSSANELADSALFSGSLAVPDADAGGVEVEFTIGAGIVAERIDLAVGLSHGDARQIEITIVSPSGTESILFYHRGENPDQFGIPRQFQGWTFGSNAFAGEDAEGVWTVRVADTVAGGAGTLSHLALDLYGEAASDDDTYFYTNEYGALTGVAHSGLLADGAGMDTINAAAVTAGSHIDLSGGTDSRINGKALTIAPGTAIEHAAGGDGDDWLGGNGAGNWLRGGRGVDSLAGLAGNDILDGGRGSDRIGGGHGDDHLLGGDGNDWLNGGSGNDLLAGGDGTADAASYGEAAAGVIVDLGRAGPQDTEGAGLDTLGGVERLIGSAHGDRFTGTAAANALWGWHGDDFLVGGGGDDWLDGGEGDDLLAGGDGLGDVASYMAAGAGVTVELGVTDWQDSGGGGTDRLDGIEHLRGSRFGDHLGGDAGANHLAGNAGDDTLAGGDGDDRLAGGAGDDLLDGGEGLDLASYADAAARVAISLAVAGPQGGAGAGLDTLSGIERLEGSAFADRLTGNADHNLLAGLGGSDWLDGGDGDDELLGGHGVDRLSGGAGNDRLHGGAGQR